MDGEVSSIALGAPGSVLSVPLRPSTTGRTAQTASCPCPHLHPISLWRLASLLCCIPTRKRRAHQGATLPCGLIAPGPCILVSTCSGNRPTMSTGKHNGLGHIGKCSHGVRSLLRQPRDRYDTYLAQGRVSQPPAHLRAEGPIPEILLHTHRATPPPLTHRPYHMPRCPQACRRPPSEGPRETGSLAFPQILSKGKGP